MAELTFEEQVKNILEESKNDIVEQTKAAVKEKIIYSLNWNLGNEISTYVKKYIEEYLKDDIEKAVIESKSEILESIKPIFSTVGAEVAKAMQKKVVDTMSTSYKADQVLRNLLGNQ